MTAPPRPDAGRQPARRRWWVVFLVSLPVCCGLVVVVIFAVNRLSPRADEATLRQELAAKLAEAASVWMVLDDLWGRLESGQTAWCSQEPVTRPYFVVWRSADRAAYLDYAALADRLNSAISNLHHAADTWTAVCGRGETGISPDTAAEARSALDRAATIINELAVVPQLAPD